VLREIYFLFKNLLIDSFLVSHVEGNYLKTDICKFESSQKNESRVLKSLQKTKSF